MYEVNTYSLERDNFLGGAYPIAKETLEVASGETIAEHALVKLSSGKAAAYAAADATAETVPYGIAAAASENGYVVVYLTGEFQESGIVLPDGVEVDAVRPLLRENGIFLVPSQANADNI